MQPQHKQLLQLQCNFSIESNASTSRKNFSSQAFVASLPVLSSTRKAPKRNQNDKLPFFFFIFSWISTSPLTSRTYYELKNTNRYRNWSSWENPSRKESKSNTYNYPCPLPSLKIFISIFKSATTSFTTRKAPQCIIKLVWTDLKFGQSNTNIISFRWDQEPAVVNAFYNPNTNDIGTL